MYNFSKCVRNIFIWNTCHVVSVDIYIFFSLCICLDFHALPCIFRKHRPIPSEVGRFLSALLSGHVPAARRLPRLDLTRRITVQFVRITLALTELL